MSRRGRAAVAVLCVIVLGGAVPGRASAAGGWPWPVPGGVVIGYGARYVSADGGGCTHGGVDLKASAGATVRSCSGGEVVFSGQVPAGEGARAWAVTVLTADGLRVTYLPLERASVAKGAAVDEGTGLGTLADSGDASSPSAHLHLGVRRGETRLDPLSFLGERASAPVSVPEPPHPTPDAAPARPQSSPVPPRVASAPVRASAGAGAPAPARAAAPGSAQAPAAVPAASEFLPHAGLAELPMLTQVPRLADRPLVRASAVAADVTSARDALAALLVRLGLAGLAGACVWPVLRRMLDRAPEPVPVPVVTRRNGA